MQQAVRPQARKPLRGLPVGGTAGQAGRELERWPSVSQAPTGNSHRQAHVQRREQGCRACEAKRSRAQRCGSAERKAGAGRKRRRSRTDSPARAALSGLTGVQHQQAQRRDMTALAGQGAQLRVPREPPPLSEPSTRPVNDADAASSEASGHPCGCRRSNCHEEHRQAGSARLRLGTHDGESGVRSPAPCEKPFTRCRGFESRTPAALGSAELGTFPRMRKFREAELGLQRPAPTQQHATVLGPPHQPTGGASAQARRPEAENRRERRGARRVKRARAVTLRFPPLGTLGIARDTVSFRKRSQLYDQVLGFPETVNQETLPPLP